MRTAGGPRRPSACAPIMTGPAIRLAATVAGGGEGGGCHGGPDPRRGHRARPREVGHRSGGRGVPPAAQRRRRLAQGIVPVPRREDSSFNVTPAAAASGTASPVPRAAMCMSSCRRWTACPRRKRSSGSPGGRAWDLGWRPACRPEPRAAPPADQGLGRRPSFYVDELLALHGHARPLPPRPAQPRPLADVERVSVGYAPAESEALTGACAAAGPARRGAARRPAGHPGPGARGTSSSGRLHLADPFHRQRRGSRSARGS